MWYEESAKTLVDTTQHPRTTHPQCQCDYCTAIREEQPAQRIERMLRGIILALGEMSAEEQDCVRVHLGDLRKQAYPPETLKDDFRTGILCNLEMFIREGQP